MPKDPLAYVGASAELFENFQFTDKKGVFLVLKLSNAIHESLMGSYLFNRMSLVKKWDLDSQFFKWVKRIFSKWF